MVLLLSINKHLLCTRQLSKHVTSMNTYNLSNKPYEISAVIIFPFYRQESGGKGRHRGTQWLSWELNLGHLAQCLGSSPPPYAALSWVYLSSLLYCWGRGSRRQTLTERKKYEGRMTNTFSKVKQQERPNLKQEPSYWFALRKPCHKTGNMQCPWDHHTACHLQEEVSGEGKTIQSFRDDRRARLKHHPRDGQAEGTRRHEPGSLFPEFCQCLEQGLRSPFCWWEHWCLQFCYKL